MVFNKICLNFFAVGKDPVKATPSIEVNLVSISPCSPFPKTNLSESIGTPNL